MLQPGLSLSWALLTGTIVPILMLTDWSEASLGRLSRSATCGLDWVEQPRWTPR